MKYKVVALERAPGNYWIVTTMDDVFIEAFETREAAVAFCGGPEGVEFDE